MALRPLSAALLLALPLAAAGGSDPTACSGPGELLIVAAGVLARGETHAYGLSGAEDDLVTALRQKAPDAHGDFSWALRDRATGATLLAGGAVEVPTPSFATSPYADLCLEVTSQQAGLTEYGFVVTASPQP